MKKKLGKKEEARAKELFSWGSRVVAEIQAYNSGQTLEARVEKYGELAKSPYGFYRGTNHLYWADFEWDWRMNRFGNYKTRTWLNGDAHAYNFGAFHAHEVGVIYGMNDFDEAVVADYQYDLWRLAISLVLIAEEKGISDPDSVRRIIHATAGKYLETLEQFGENSGADGVYYNSKNTYGPLKKFLKKLEAKEDKRAEMIEKWTTGSGEKHRFDLENKPDKLAPASDTARLMILNAMPGYIATIKGDGKFGKGFFNVEDIALRISAGTGSLGTSRYYILIAGEDSKAAGDDLILDVKLQGRPSAFPYATEAQKREYFVKNPHEGVRHSRAYRALGYHPDDLLGWMELGGQYYSVRERSPYKEEFPTKKIKGEDQFVEVAEQWGAILATHHSRADKVMPFNFAAEVKSLTHEKGEKAAFCDLVSEVAIGYSEQVKDDFETFVRFWPHPNE